MNRLHSPLTCLLPMRLFRRGGPFLLIAALLLIWIGTPTTTATVRAAGASVPPPGTVVHAASCEQAPPQSVKDRANYSSAELARYGLPPRAPGEPFDKWAKIVRSVEKRVCDYTIGVGHWWVLIHNSNWAGYVADESSPGQNYTEADMDYYVPCITGSPPDLDHPGTAVMAAWIGLGGNNGIGPLVQAGTAAFQYWDPIHGYQSPVYTTFVENTGPDPKNPDPPHYFFNVSCNTHMYASVWGGDCMFVYDIDTKVSTGNQCYGNAASNQSGEAIAERNTTCTCYPYFAHFTPVTFHGVAISDNGHYDAMYQVPHNQDQPDECTNIGGSGICTSWYIWATTGDIQLDPNENPNDMYTVTWKNY